MGQIKSVVVCLFVDTPTVAFFNQSSRNWEELLGSKKEELIMLGSKSENTFPYFNPQKPKINRQDRQFLAKY